MWGIFQQTDRNGCYWYCQKNMTSVNINACVAYSDMISIIVVLWACQLLHEALDCKDVKSIR